MTYVANNPVLYNACLGAASAALNAGANSQTGAAATTANANATAAALQVAQAVDTLITGDATITTAGATTPPTTSAIQGAQLAKGRAMGDATYSALVGTGGSGVIPAAPLQAIAAAIAAKYSATITAPFSLL